jgi:hypothetical protein
MPHEGDPPVTRSLRRRATSGCARTGCPARLRATAVLPQKQRCERRILKYGSAPTKSAPTRSCRSDTNAAFNSSSWLALISRAADPWYGRLPADSLPDAQPVGKFGLMSTDDADAWHELMQQAKPLRLHYIGQKGDAAHIPAGPVNTACRLDGGMRIYPGPSSRGASRPRIVPLSSITRARAFSPVTFR